jgi:protein gp37
MAKNSKIEWTHHTFNPWWGCVKLSPACKHCYAETWARRVGQQVWGIRAPRRFFSDDHWNAPKIWEKEAQTEGLRRRVFCASMADVFEDRRELDVWRERLWALIAQTPHLDWLLLTKRPEKIAGLTPWGKSWPENVWLGTTAETQKWANDRIPALVKNPAKVLFLSCEPLLGPLDLNPWIETKINWVIAGGESGGKSRPTDPQWVRQLRDQCVNHKVPFHFKQWGNWAPINEAAERKRIKMLASGETLVRVNKKDAGRSLDGRTWDGSPIA